MIKNFIKRMGVISIIGLFLGDVGCVSPPLPVSHRLPLPPGHVVHVPRVHVPRVYIPGISVPRLYVPRVRKPRAYAPRFPVPRVRVPRGPFR